MAGMAQGPNSKPLNTSGSAYSHPDNSPITLQQFQARVQKAPVLSRQQIVNDYNATANAKAGSMASARGKR